MAEMAGIPPNCISPNPDIAGVGIRAAIYVQNIWCQVVVLLVYSHRKVRENRIKLMQTQLRTIILTTGALFSSAFIQAATYGLSAYHAVIVLSLGWINCMSVIIFSSATERRSYEGPVNPKCQDPSNLFNPLARLERSRLGFFRIFLLHASFGMFAAFGLWFWATVDTFGANAQCMQRLPVPIRIFGHTHLSTSSATRKAFLVVYTYFALISLGGILDGVIKLIDPEPTSDEPDPLRSVRETEKNRLMVVVESLSAFLMNMGVLVAIIVSTESLVHEVALAGESEWTYGQTISIFLLLPGLVETLETLNEKEEAKTAENDEQPGGTVGNEGDMPPAEAGNNV